MSLEQETTDFKIKMIKNLNLLFELLDNIIVFC